MSRDILNIGGEPIFDDRIVKIETHTYNLYANTTFGYSDEIQIPIQHQDLYTLPCELNSDFYPYDDMNLDFKYKKYAILYDMYVKFQKIYRRISCTRSIRTVIDCSRQNESVKSTTVDIRIQFECMENIPLNTTAYCLIIHDWVIEYNPLTNVIRKIV
ncbi:hypothetical protein ALC57_15465 [Trachymyrmex cornetzi]|uniref:Double jelly roll-like domain-containing protein n=1 Tax=Trachymyrmex cornetzi TaxID=471704 RepID=A0A151IX56_9HYME|nr:hypothetical protein ALC57_15465 [Trachymyrmex cornetzi]